MKYAAYFVVFASLTAAGQTGITSSPYEGPPTHSYMIQLPVDDPMVGQVLQCSKELGGVRPCKWVWPFMLLDPPEPESSPLPDQIPGWLHSSSGEWVTQDDPRVILPTSATLSIIPCRLVQLDDAEIPATEETRTIPEDERPDCKPLSCPTAKSCDLPAICLAPDTTEEVWTCPTHGSWILEQSTDNRWWCRRVQ